MVWAALATLMAGCAWFDTPRPAAAPAIAVQLPPPVLSADAIAALQTARQRVAHARTARTLWRSAAEKLAEAEIAAVKNDSNTTLRLSHEIVALCEKSTAQASLPPVVW